MTELQFVIAERNEIIYHYLQQRLKNWNLNSSMKLTSVSWFDLWNCIRDAIYQRQGFEITEVGSTWLGSLVGMNALRPIEPLEINQIGQPDSFLPAAWNSTMIKGDQRVWGIPWMTDTRIIYVWRDLLEAQGIDCDTAFQTPEQMEETFQLLQAGGMATPWITMTNRDNNIIFNLAPWVWQAGGNFLSPNLKSTAFAEADAVRGIEAYFRLRRYMIPGSSISERDAVYRFSRREAAVTLSGPWLLTRLRDPYENPAGIADLCLVLPPGPAFVGGSHLVMLKHTQASMERPAINLISRMTAWQSQMELGAIMGMLPVRLDAMNDPIYAEDPYYQTMIAALKGGRSFPAAPRWNVVEEGLTDAFFQIWRTIESNPSQPIQDVIAQHLEPLARHLDTILTA